MAGCRAWPPLGVRQLVLGQSRARQALRVLSQGCPRLSREEDFAGSVLYEGRASLCTAQSVALALLLQRHDEASDWHAAKQSAFDQCWHEVQRGLTMVFPGRDSVEGSRSVGPPRRLVSVRVPPGFARFKGDLNSGPGAVPKPHAGPRITAAPRPAARGGGGTGQYQPMAAHPDRVQAAVFFQFQPTVCAPRKHCSFQLRRAYRVGSVCTTGLSVRDAQGYV